MVKGNRQELLPPWKKYPEIRRFSIGWRMGRGEEYLFDWSNWFSKLSKAEKEEYKNKYPQPLIWFGTYKKFL